jgi:hypothetical protein
MLLPGTKRVNMENPPSVTTCEAYHRGELPDYEYPAEAIGEAMTHLPAVPAM